ncbi:MAG: diguanylate cyclase [Oscillospiraceae bacterium]|nr:diguanylate cyclase [Oscillospiraceae bacterium]
MEEESKNSILIVDDVESNLLALSRILDSEYSIFTAGSGREAILAAEESQPDVILLDILMPEMDGYQVLAELREREKTRNIPVIFISGLSDALDEEIGLTLGAADYISKPFSPTIAKLRVQNQIKILNQLRTIERLSMIDQLTAVPNRRGFDYHASMEWGRAIREKTPLGILLIDVDKFKDFNDTYGHRQGDEVLTMVAKTMNKSLNRRSDYIARWGGEEFVALLPSTDLTGSLEVAERIRASIEDTAIGLPDGTEARITISIGVSAMIPTNDSMMEDFFVRADMALYKAKEAGRNRVSWI